MSAFAVPPWPARELRQMVVARTEQPQTFRNASLALSVYNSWGLLAASARSKNRQGSISAPFSWATASLRIVLSGGSWFLVLERLREADHDQEFMQSWWLSGMVEMESMKWRAPRSAEELERSVDPAQVESTMTWLVGAAQLARARGVKFLIALAPSPATDPRYVEFWSPWPRYRSSPMARVVWHRALRAALVAKGVPIADLEDNLQGISGTYRLSDGHWTRLGTDIAAKRLAAEMLKLRP